MELHDKHVRCVEIKPITLYESRLKALLDTFWQNSQKFLDPTAAQKKNKRKSANFENLTKRTYFSQGSQFYPWETQSFDQNPQIIWINHINEISIRWRLRIKKIFVNKLYSIGNYNLNNLKSFS